MFSFFAMDCPPPVENTLLISPQHGHAYPLMFSITPKRGRETVRVNETHFIASRSATACGVVTTIPDKRERTGDRCSISEMCSSEVPVQSGRGSDHTNQRESEDTVHEPHRPRDNL